MPFIFLYFQYTHLSNTELNTLRELVNTWSGKTQLVSSKDFTKCQLSVTFGKLLLISIPQSIFKYSMVSDLLSKYKVLHLLFVNVHSFFLSPSLYTAYTTNKLKNTPFQQLYGLNLTLNSIRLILFKIRYMHITMHLLFQETLLYKNNIQYIC